MQVSEEAEDLRYDLAIDASGGQPTLRDSGLDHLSPAPGPPSIWLLVGILGSLGAAVTVLGRSFRRAAFLP
jgi:hypothetical protein